MVFVFNPVSVLVKAPFPVPLIVLLFRMVGLGFVLQHTPLANTADPPSKVIAPPVMNDDVVILLAAVVVNIGRTAFVVPTT